jgi:hypothetical protein
MNCLCGDISFHEVSRPILTEQEKSEKLAASKRCVTVTTIVLAILVILAFCLLFYLENHPLDTSLHWLETFSIVSLIVLDIGFLISFIRCVDIYKWLGDPRLERLDQEIKQLEKDIKQIKENN